MSIWLMLAIWIALVGLFVHVDIKYWDFLTLEDTFITPTFCVWVMKVPSVFLISPYFMVFFSFCHFLSQVHETLQKSDASIFSNFHNPRYMKPCQNLRLESSPIFMTPHTWNLDSWIFSNFHDPGYMKPCKNQRFQFSLIFMNPGTSCKNQMLQFSLIFMTPGTWNLWQNLRLQFSLIFMNPGTSCKNRMLQFSLIFMTPGTWNLAKIWGFNFL